MWCARTAIPRSSPETGQRPLAPALLEGCDLTLMMTRDQREVAVGLTPRKLRRVFTALEFVAVARVLHGSSRPAVAAPGAAAERWDLLIRQVADTRYMKGPIDDEDIADPIGHGEAAYQRFADELMPTLSIIREVPTTIGRGFGHNGRIVPTS